MLIHYNVLSGVYISVQILSLSKINIRRVVHSIVKNKYILNETFVAGQTINLAPKCISGLWQKYTDILIKNFSDKSARRQLRRLKTQLSHTLHLCTVCNAAFSH